MINGVVVTGIRLVTTGKLNGPGECIEVHAEVNGIWHKVISELKDGPISHIVEPSGILNSPRAD